MLTNAVAATHVLRHLTLGTQTYKVLNHLVLKGSVSPLEANKIYGVERLTSRIFDIKRTSDILGTPVSIAKELRNDNAGKRYMRYYLKNN